MGESDVEAVGDHVVDGIPGDLVLGLGEPATATSRAAGGLRLEAEDLEQLALPSGEGDAVIGSDGEASGGMAEGGGAELIEAAAQGTLRHDRVVDARALLGRDGPAAVRAGDARVLGGVAGGGLDEEGKSHERAVVEGKPGAVVEDGRADDDLVPSVRQVQPDGADGQPLEGAALRGE